MSNNLRSYRKSTGISIIQLANLSGLSRSTISKIERGGNGTNVSMGKIYSALKAYWEKNDLRVYTVKEVWGKDIKFNQSNINRSNKRREERKNKETVDKFIELQNKKSVSKSLNIAFNPAEVSNKRVAEFIDILSEAFGLELEITKAVPHPPSPVRKRKAA